MVVDSLLRSLNAPNEEIDLKWAQVAERRLQELRTGVVKYTAAPEQNFILAVMHLHRDPDYWKHRL